MAHRDWYKGSRAASLLQCMGPILLLHLALVRADGKLFTVESKNGSQGLDLAGAQRSCATLGSRLATAEELRRAVRECSFTICTKGWLADTTIGRTVCHKMGSGQQVMKTIDVITESAPSPSDRYDAFCVKDEDKPCGDPPSFPHTTLHGHTEFEMGDELHYVCAHGYIMGNREAAFTLLCDSCGEWYGHVQACVKNDTTTHIDYEDNFPDDRTMSVTEPGEDDGEEDGEEEEHPFSKETELKTGQEEALDVLDSTETESKAPTESPVSLLSQKHLFWFPPEDFNEPEGEQEPEVGRQTQFSNGNNHIGVKTDFSESGTNMIYDSEDFPIGPYLVNNDTKTAKYGVVSTDRSWLDGYPVTQDALEEGEKTDGSMELDEDIILSTDQTNYVEVKKAFRTTPIPDRAVTHIAVAPTRLLDYGIKGAQVPLTPASAPENVSTSQGFDDLIRYQPTRPMDFSVEESTTTTLFSELTETPSTAILETYNTASHIDHLPAPTESGETTTYLNLPDTKTNLAQTPAGFTETSSSKGGLEGETQANELEGEPLPTSEPCLNENCQGTSKGPMIAIIVTVLCLLLLATVLAVWCYKKRQQKSSVYKLNGKGQTRHPQQIEMQKV